MEWIIGKNGGTKQASNFLGKYWKQDNKYRKIIGHLKRKMGNCEKLDWY